MGAGVLDLRFLSTAGRHQRRHPLHDPVGNDIFPELSFVGEVNDHREERALTKKYFSQCIMDGITKI